MMNPPRQCCDDISAGTLKDMGRICYSCIFYLGLRPQYEKSASLLIASMHSTQAQNGPEWIAGKEEMGEVPATDVAT
jgi:hypothetical protein